jgi:hypothetical protein
MCSSICLLFQPGMSFCSNTSSGYSVEPQRPPVEMFNIISLQSSARPGCIIEFQREIVQIIDKYR